MEPRRPTHSSPFALRQVKGSADCTDYWQEHSRFHQLNVILCREKYVLCREEQEVTPRARKQKQQAVSPSEWEERGDGPVLGALLLAGLLDQTSDFKLDDLSTAVRNAAVYESQLGEIREILGT